MKILKMHFSNFKRFSNLNIENIPNSSKLILLIGSNGSGKSTVFDAFSFINNSLKGFVKAEDYSDYYRKDKAIVSEVCITFEEQGEVKLKDDEYGNIKLSSNSFYGRTSFRQVPKLTRTTLGQNRYQDKDRDFDNDSDRPKFFIERDIRFENDVEIIIETILKDFFRGNQSTEQIRERYLNPINKALHNIFGENEGTKLDLIEIIPPLEGKTAQINFRKGVSEIHYNFLSAGEKEVFNLLINLLSRRSIYQDTIYFLDEIDLHLNTKLQFNLLKEITENWIPENCQLWTASHSLGFIEYAKQANTASIFDFDELDFDLPQILSPKPKDNPDIYEIAVGKAFLPSLFQQFNIYFVENKDKEYYGAIGLEEAVFISANNRNNVYNKINSTEYFGIVDRDFLSDDDILEIRQHYQNLYVLKYYSIENYLYHPENLEEYYSKAEIIFDKAEYVSQIISAKNQIKDDIIPTLSLKRTAYPYFGEPEYIGTPRQNKFKNKDENAVQSAIVAGYLNNNEFEIFYKSLPMKTYCTSLPQRQNIAKSALAKTNWFKSEIVKLLL